MTIAFIAMLFGLTPSLAYARSSQQVTLAMSGVITDVGTQRYSNSGGALISASVLGTVLDPTSTSFHYTLTASITGLDVKGDLQFRLAGTHGGGVLVVGTAKISGMLSAESFPLSCGNPGEIPVSPCKSAVPGFFLGVAQVTIMDDLGTRKTTLPIVIESAFLNPFGGPIVIGSTDDVASPSLLIVTGYSQATIHWHGVALAGTVSSRSALGSFAISTDAVEDLVAGIEHEHGTIAIAGLAPELPDIIGTYSGDSTIPQPGSGSDCSAEITGIPGTCTLTGFLSSGQFSARSTQGVSMIGSYVTIWTTPAIAFESEAEALLTT